MKVIASSLRKGNIVDLDGKLYVILTAENIHPGKGTPVTQLDMRRLSDGVKSSQRYKTTDQVERAHVEERSYQFLYQDGEGFHFMNMENYEQLTAHEDVIGDGAKFLQPEMSVKLQVHEGTPVVDRAAAARHPRGGRDRAGHEGTDRVGIVQAGGAVERRAHRGADPHRRRHADRDLDRGRVLRRAGEGLRLRKAPA